MREAPAMLAVKAELLRLEAAISADRLRVAREAGASELSTVRLEVLSSRSSLRATQAANLLASWTERPAGASDAC